MIAGAINRANAAAVSIADAFVAVQIEAATGTPTPATGIASRDDSPRLLKAVETILEDSVDDDEVQTRLDRLAG